MNADIKQGSFAFKSTKRDAQPVPGGNRAQRRAFYAIARSKKPENKKLYAELMNRKHNKTQETK